MCFYLYAPNRKINVLYKSEFISLAPDATSIVATDILIRDPCPPENPKEQIKELFIIYPNRLYTSKKKKNVLGSIDFFFRDATETFSDKSANRLYDLYNSHIDPPSPLYKNPPEWATYLGFQLQSPSNPEQISKFEGFICKPQNSDHKKKNLTVEDFSYEQKLLLDKINFTILRYELDIPLGQHARWIRLGFKGKRSAKTSIFAKSTRLLKFTNSLIYFYHVLGPNNIKDKFISTLLSITNSPDNSPPVKLATERLISRFVQDGLIESSKHDKAVTTFHNIFSRISPTKMEQLNLIREETICREFPFPEYMLLNQKKYTIIYRLAKSLFSFPEPGDIKCHYTGFYKLKKSTYYLLRKIIPPSLRKKEIHEQHYMTIYRWKQQEDDQSRPQTPVGSFSINFEAKPFNLKYLLICILALVFSFTAITIGTINYCEKHWPTIVNDLGTSITNLNKNITILNNTITTNTSGASNSKTVKSSKKYR